MRLVKYIVFIAILIGIGLLLKDIDFRQTMTVLRDMNYPLLAFVFVLGFGNFFLVGFRFFLLLQTAKKDISYHNVMMATISAIAINSSGPGKLGVPAKALLLKKLEGLPVSRAIPSLALELFFDISGLAILLVISGLILDMHSVVWQSFKNIFILQNVLIVAGLALAVLGGVYVLRSKLAKNDFIRNLGSAIKNAVLQKEVFAFGAALTLANLVLSFWGDQLLFKAMGQDIPYTFIVFSSSFTTIAGILSPMPGGFGVWELSRAFLFKTYFNIADLAVIMTLLRRFLTYIALAILYLVYNRLQSPQLPELVDEAIAEPDGGVFSQESVK